MFLDRFCAVVHALVSFSGDAFRSVADDALAQLGRGRHVSLSFHSFLALSEVLRATDLMAVVPRRLGASADGFTTIAPPTAMPGFTKVAVWHRGTHHDERLRWARTLLFATCGAVEARDNALLRCRYEAE